MEITFKVGEQFPSLTGKAADSFGSELIRLEDADFEEVVLDFKGVTGINSMSMGSIFATSQKLKEQGRKLRIVNVGPQVRRMLDMVSMSHLVDIEDAKG